jgi:hypothetical protein
LWGGLSSLPADIKANRRLESLRHMGIDDFSGRDRMLTEHGVFQYNSE